MGVGDRGLFYRKPPASGEFLEDRQKMWEAFRALGAKDPEPEPEGDEEEPPAGKDGGGQ